MDCIFCKIINKKIPSEIIYEDEEILAFKNINPEAPIHLLFVPKKHIEWQDELNEKDLSLLTGLISVAKKVATEQDILDACKIIFNIGKTGEISHIHLHLLGGWKDKIPKHNI
jgi:histidine triad (HIT) family protein